MTLYKTALAVFFIFLMTMEASAQFERPTFKKVETTEIPQFQNLIRSFNLTGNGLYGETVIDNMYSLDIRAKLQGAFGDPTKTIEVLAEERNFRLAEAIQFEYWFLIEDPLADGPVPLLVLDIHGPFQKGVTLGAASRYTDLMPQILREFERLLIQAQPKGFKDYYLEGDNGQWYFIQSDGVNHDVRETKQPAHIKLN